jgi:hypothetical protein
LADRGRPIFLTGYTVTCRKHGESDVNTVLTDDVQKPFKLATRTIARLECVDTKKSIKHDYPLRSLDQWSEALIRNVVSI